jgi:hypothetical protein
MCQLLIENKLKYFTDNNKLAITIGIHVPGPLTKI